MEIKSYNAHELRELVQSPDFRRLKHLPISRLRAASYLNNPRAVPDKKMLFIGWINNEVAAYRLMLPDIIYLNGEPEEVAWFSCVWVDPEKRGLGLARKLVTLALEEWGDYIMGADPVVASKTMYQQHYNFAVPAIDGLRLYFRFNMAEILVKKKPSLKPAKPILGMGDTVANMFQDMRLNGYQVKQVPNYEVVPEVDDDLTHFISGFQQNELFRRGKNELNWITQYPWIREGVSTAEDEKYYFSSVSRQFRQQHIKVLDESNITIGYVLCTLRDGHLKIPYAYFEANNTEAIAKVLLKLALEHQATMLTTFNPLLTDYFMKNKGPAIFAKQIKRYYLVSEKLLPFVNTGTQANFKEGDGDQAFT